MRVLLKPGLLVVAPEDEAERASFSSWCEGVEDHAFHLVMQEGGAVLHDLGSRPDACREPLNISSQVEPQWQAISNFALSPFYLDGRHYASVEGFWQGLKFDDEAERRRIAALHGGQAKHAGDAAEAREHFVYDGATIGIGTYGHWSLMERACRAKFAANADARDALLATGDRWLMHRLRRDSRTIPGAIMADIWMKIRASLRAADGASA